MMESSRAALPVLMGALVATTAACALPARGAVHIGARDGGDPARGPSFPSVVARLARTVTAGSTELRAIPVSVAYLDAFHFRRANADLLPPHERARRLAIDLRRYTGASTAFVVTVRARDDVARDRSDPLTDLRAWTFRLGDGRGARRDPDLVQPWERWRSSRSERVGVFPGNERVVYEHVARGIVRFAYATGPRTLRLVLVAWPPGAPGHPLVTRWRVAP